MIQLKVSVKKFKPVVYQVMEVPFLNHECVSRKLFSHKWLIFSSAYLTLNFLVSSSIIIHLLLLLLQAGWWLC